MREQFADRGLRDAEGERRLTDRAMFDHRFEGFDLAQVKNLFHGMTRGRT